MYRNSCRALSSASEEDTMNRWPGLRSSKSQLRLLDYLGTMSFASSGAITAAAAQMDALGSILVGCVTAIGGGTIRDSVILGKKPFWTEEVEYLYLSLLTAGATFFFWPRNEDNAAKNHSSLQWIDALGVGAFATIGAQNGIRARMPVLVTVSAAISRVDISVSFPFSLHRLFYESVTGC